MASTGDTKQTSGEWQGTGAKKREKLPTKVVIRRLPPAIEKDSLLNQISPLPDYDYFYLVNGEAALRENSFSQAYINFTNIFDVYAFKERFDNYVFLDDRGNEYPAVVEFPPFQKIPKKRNKVRSDPKCGTIESDPYYLEFLENLNKPKELEDKLEYSYQLSSDNKDKHAVTTPLLELVKSRRAERRRIRQKRRKKRKKKVREEKFMSELFSKMKLDNKDMSDNNKREEGFEKCESKNENFSERSFSHKIIERKFEKRKRNTNVTSPRKEFVDKREFKNIKEQFKEPKVREEKFMSELFSKMKLDNKDMSDNNKREEGFEKCETKNENFSERSFSHKIRERKFEKRKRNTNVTSPRKEFVDKREFKNIKEQFKEPKVDPLKIEEVQVPKKVKKYSEKREERNFITYRPGMLFERNLVEGDDKELTKYSE